MHGNRCVDVNRSNYRLQDIQLSAVAPWRFGETGSSACQLFDSEIVWDEPPTRLTALRRAKLSLSRPSSRSRAKAEPQAPSMPVVIGSGSHPFPFRTRKLSLIPPMVLHGKLCGRVGRCRHYFDKRPDVETRWAFSFLASMHPPIGGHRPRG